VQREQGSISQRRCPVELLGLRLYHCQFQTRKAIAYGKCGRAGFSQLVDPRRTSSDALAIAKNFRDQVTTHFGDEKLGIGATDINSGRALVGPRVNSDHRAN
jgi:hypothetical protein